tara:strand:+ start:2703 stop:3575 length:873 start_codon:yes stop_codon:yes gene_type:complete
MIRKYLTCFTLVAITCIPIGAADREHEQLMADIRMLQEQTLRLHHLIAALEGTLSTLSGRLDAQDADRKRSFADQKLTTENMATGVRVLREKLDETNVRLSSMSQEVEALRISIPRTPPPPVTPLLIDPETGLPMDNSAPAAAPETPEPAPAVTAAESPVLAGGVSPQRMYDTAWADYTNGQWALSIQGFEAYIKTFPRSELTDDAAFYIGQTHYAEGNFDDSIIAFEQVLLNYPDGDIVPEASYKRGLALDRLGEIDRARTAFELVVNNYPDHMMATLAQQALDRLEQQ